MAQQAAAPALGKAWSSESALLFFRVGNCGPVFDEMTAFDLPVKVAIPQELHGRYVRYGPNPRRATAHWFTGEMIHGVRLKNGRAAWHRNRGVRTESFQ